MPYVMHIEYIDGSVKMHPYHLGTDIRGAETFVFEALSRPNVQSVALRQNNKLIRIYDMRDLECFSAP